MEKHEKEILMTEFLKKIIFIFCWKIFFSKFLKIKNKNQTIRKVRTDPEGLLEIKMIPILASFFKTSISHEK